MTPEEIAKEIVDRVINKPYNDELKLEIEISQAIFAERKRYAELLTKRISILECALREIVQPDFSGIDTSIIFLKSMIYEFQEIAEKALGC